MAPVQNAPNPSKAHCQIVKSIGLHHAGGHTGLQSRVKLGSPQVPPAFADIYTEACRQPWRGLALAR
jgi:hypothetical protein